VNGKEGAKENSRQPLLYLFPLGGMVPVDTKEKHAQRGNPTGLLVLLLLLVRRLVSALGCVAGLSATVFPLGG
jgi:hypothetical protein